MSKLVEFGTVSAETKSTYLQGMFVDGNKVFVPSLNMWVFLTSDNDPTAPLKQAPIG